MGVVKEMNQLGLAEKYEGRVRLCFDIVEKLIPASEIYLYGSYAQYSPVCEWLEEKPATNTYNSQKMSEDYFVDQILRHSKLSILVLIGEGSSYREMRTLCWEVEDLICHISDDSFLIDIRVLSRSFYKECLRKSSEMQKLDRQKKDLRQIQWIDK